MCGQHWANYYIIVALACMTWLSIIKFKSIALQNLMVAPTSCQGNNKGHKKAHTHLNMISIDENNIQQDSYNLITTDH